MQGFSEVPTGGTSAIVGNVSSQVQFSPSGKFLALTNRTTLTTNYHWLGRWNGASYESVPTIFMRSVAFNADETRILTFNSAGTAVELRSFNPVSGAIGNAVLASIATSDVSAIYSLGANLFAVVNAAPSNSRVDIVSVTGNTMAVTVSLPFPSRIYGCDVQGNVIYLATYNNANGGRVVRIAVNSAGTPAITNLENAGSGTLIRIAANQQNSRFHKSAAEPENNRIGPTNPLSYENLNFNGKSGSYSAFIFDGTVLQIIQDNGTRLNLDAETLAIRADIQNAPALGQVTGTLKVFSSAGARFAWVRNHQSGSSGAPFSVIDEEIEPAEARQLPVGLMGVPSISADTGQYISPLALGLMGDAFVVGDSVVVSIEALGPMGSATINFSSVAAKLQPIGIMATSEVIADNTKGIEATAIGLMGDAYAFINRPGVCKSPR